MKATINEKAYSSYEAQCLGYRHIGEFGHADGFEEQLYMADDGQHFVYGVGGPESPYVEPEIILLTEQEATVWRRKTKSKVR